MVGELHEGLGQHLLLIKHSTEMVRKKLDDGSEERAHLGEVTEIVSDAIIDVRSVTANLCPGGLNHLGLRAAILAMIERVAKHTRITVEHKLISLDRNWTAHDQIAIVRPIQEGLNNAGNHDCAAKMSGGDSRVTTWGSSLFPIGDCWLGSRHVPCTIASPLSCFDSLLGSGPGFDVSFRGRE
jgi:signal transduction histidine kinase